MKNLNYLMDHILYQIFKIISDPQIRIYVNKLENKITFKMKARCYLEFFTSEIIKLLGNTPLTQNFHLLKYGLQIKILNH